MITSNEDANDILHLWKHCRIKIKMTQVCIKCKAIMQHPKTQKHKKQKKDGSG